ncbi:MAG: 2,3-bisphosphoglycerate-independent phosphoglycerate mutase [Alphaproteobacteria bacterium ADurb.Bin438]|nr:MAG: 2,3-bisphosphoglycerate-independent phosphoglycerate mutase [Alphaproteobacteria bacterium ADurb.Bin438]
MTNKLAKRPTVLCILDGWGYREDANDNAIKNANVPNWNRFLKEYPYTLIETSGEDVGLPDGQMGNSEVGHMNIGAGRIVMQELPRISKAFKTHEVEQKQVMIDLVNKLKQNGGACHIAGLMSDGGVHSHQDHILGLCEIMSKNGIKTYVHALLDGRDTPPQSGIDYVAAFEKEIAKLNGVMIATVGGRYYGMDRDNRWERVELALKALIDAKGEVFENSNTLIETSYANSKNDEFVIPAIIKGYQGMKDGDGFIMANFRSDRARELTRALLEPSFDKVADLRKVKFVDAIAMTEYSVEHNAWMKVIFPPERLTKIYGEIIVQNGLKQLRIAETEKYAHVTFFFNGGEEAVYEGEDRILIPSPKVATYDLKPEMSAFEVIEKLEEAVLSEKYDTIIVNFANGDMVGHTGMMDAAIKAVEAVDQCIGRLEKAILKVNGNLIVTADHGNCELMKDQVTGKPYTAHTVGKVYAVMVNCGEKAKNLRELGRLADLTPTMLDLMGIAQPAEMTGVSLIKK